MNPLFFTFIASFLFLTPTGLPESLSVYFTGKYFISLNLKSKRRKKTKERQFVSSSPSPLLSHLFHCKSLNPHLLLHTPFSPPVFSPLLSIPSFLSSLLHLLQLFSTYPSSLSPCVSFYSFLSHFHFYFSSFLNYIAFPFQS